MPAPLSTHLQGVAGATEQITGSLTVDTGLRKIQSVVANMNSALVVNEENHVQVVQLPRVPGTTAKITLNVLKGGTNIGNAGDTEVSVSWLAVGE